MASSSSLVLEELDLADLAPRAVVAESVVGMVGLLVAERLPAYLTEDIRVHLLDVLVHGLLLDGFVAIV